jgi:hypothetical protein
MDLQQIGAGCRLDLHGWGKKQIMGIPWSDEKLLDFQGLCSMESVGLLSFIWHKISIIKCFVTK